jgi:hypothetical protein
MTRLEYQEVSPKEEIERTLKEVRSKEKPKRRLSFKSGCCLFLFIVFLGFLFLVTVVIAKTGIVDIPLISNWFYKKPEPIHRVKSLAKEIDLNKRFSFSKEGLVSLKLSEQDLTTLISQGLEQNQDLPFANIQAAIVPEKIEFFGELTQPVSTYITLSIKPVIVSGKLNFYLTEFKVGNILLPLSVVEKMISNLLNEQIESLNQALSSELELQEIILRAKELEIQGRIIKAIDS